MHEALTHGFVGGGGWEPKCLGLREEGTESLVSWSEAGGGASGTPRP